MNPTMENQQIRGPGDDHLLDRLVDGELPDTERRKLLLKFEMEPDGWRRCALAFLEAQTWRQALASETGSQWGARPESVKGVSAGFSAPFASCSERATRSKFWRPVARLSGLAAGLIVAFALGWTYHRGVEQPAPSANVNQQAGSGADQLVQPPQHAAVQVATQQSRPNKPADSQASVNPLVKHWQQRGYSVETEQRLVSMESKDGRKVKLPVQEVRIRYIGDRI